MESSYNELYHHGIKGMKWGVRRYQNEDGSLTEAGRRRSGKISGATFDENRNIAYGNAMADDMQFSKGFNAGANASKSMSNIAKRKADKKRSKKVKKIMRKENVSEMSDQELRKKVDRMNLERNYMQLKSGTIRTGRDKVADILDTAGDIFSVGASAASIMLAIHSLKR